MLVSQTIDPRMLLADVRAVVVDEIHAFAGDDRGWHLLAVLERVAQLTGRPLQRVGLSATVGNATSCCTGSKGAARRASRPVVMPRPAPRRHRPPARLRRSTANAAKVIAALHLGEKRLVFADIASTVEELASHLRARGGDVRLPLVAGSLGTASSGAGLRRGPQLRHRLDVHPGAGDRRRGPRPGHPDRCTVDGGFAAAATGADRTQTRHDPQPAVPVDFRRGAASGGCPLAALARATSSRSTPPAPRHVPRSSCWPSRCRSAGSTCWTREHRVAGLGLASPRRGSRDRAVVG